MVAIPELGLADERLGLAAAVAAIDLGGYLDVPPATLALGSTPWSGRPAADCALRYSRGHGGLPYDEIADRFHAALPFRPATMVQTAAAERRERLAASTRDDRLERLIAEIGDLRHRPIDLPAGTTGGNWSGDDRWVTFEVDDDQLGSPLPLSFSYAHPPTVLRTSARPADVGLFASQAGPGSLPAISWVPFLGVLEAGAFPRFSSGDASRSSSWDAGQVYLFVSHRWRSTDAPDPDGRQARHLARVLLTAIVEAALVAHDRGLRAPRQVDAFAGRPVGRAGSALAEALLVNLLRPNLADGEVDALAQEVAVAGPLVDTLPGHGPIGDADLRHVTAAVSSMPLMRRLLARVWLWVDHSCVPQAPRTADEDALFRECLASLTQALTPGATILLIEDVDDYLGRAWCVLEASAASALASLVGEERWFVAWYGSAAFEPDDWARRRRIEDLTQLVWRGLLDTELFGVQTADDCLARLGLAATDPADLAYVQGELLRVGPPDAVTSDADVVTGGFPLPVTADRTGVVWRNTTGHPTQRKVVVRSERVLPGDDGPLLHTRRTLAPRAPLVTRALTVFDGPDADLWTDRARDGVHIAVVGGCEGEAILLAEWVVAHRDLFDGPDGQPVVSMSWTAVDAVPVGAMPSGVLQALPILSRHWAVVALRSRFPACPVVEHLVELARNTSSAYATCALDPLGSELRWMEPAPGETAMRTAPLGPDTMRHHPGGLYSSQLVRFLVPS